MLQNDLFDIFADQWLGAVDGASAEDCNLICFCGRGLDDTASKRQANAIYDVVSKEALDALIVWTTILGIHVGQERLEEFCRRFAPLPIVSVEQRLGDAPMVLMENRRGMFEAVCHLIEVHGHRRIAFLRGPATHDGIQERYQGYLDALAKHGLTADPDLVSAPAESLKSEATDSRTPSARPFGLGGLATDQDQGVLSGSAAHAVELDAAWLRRIADAAEPPDAVAAASDGFALAAMSALAASGLRTPDDIAFVGFDDSMNVGSADLGLASARHETGAGAVNLDTLSLTTVRAPFHELGRRAVEVAMALIRGEPVPDVTLVPTELVVRRSCGCSPSAALDASAATLGEDQITTQLRHALAGASAELPADWPEQLSAAFTDEMQAGSGGKFLALLNEFVLLSLRSGEQVENWSRALSLLRRLIRGTTASVDETARAEAVWLKAQLLLASMAERRSGYLQVVVGKRNQVVRDVGQQLNTASDLDELVDMLPGELAKLGIPSCYLASYGADTPGDEESSAEPIARARLLLAYEKGTRADVAAHSAVFPSVQLVPGGRLRRPSAYSMVAVPLYLRDQRLGYALLEVGPRIGWIYAALRDQLSSALHRAFVVARERAAVAALEEAHRREERRRLASDLHDSVSQALFSMNLHARALQLAVQREGNDPNGSVARGLADLRGLTKDALAEMRALIFELRPEALHEDGLVAAIRRHAAMVAARQGFDVLVQGPEDPLPLAADAETELFRVLREALHNSVKHAHPGRVEIRLHEPADAPRTLVIEISDDGVGFDPHSAYPGHLGLSTMRERTERLGGRLTIDSSPASSTTVRAVLPDILLERPANGAVTQP